MSRFAQNASHTIGMSHLKEKKMNNQTQKQIKNLNERKCHFCGKKLSTKGKNMVCSKCKEEYTIIDGKAYRENVYSRMYNKSFKD